MGQSPPPKLIALLSVGAGLGAATVYYNQPMLGTLVVAFGSTPTRIGFVPTITQLGYAAGIVLFGPLGDKLDRRTVIVAKLWLLVIPLVLAGIAWNVSWMLVASLLMGIF